MEVYQCPCCALRFQFSSELVQHLSAEHPDFEVRPKTIEDALLTAGHRHRHAEGYRPAGDGNAS